MEPQLFTTTMWVIWSVGAVLLALNLIGAIICAVSAYKTSHWKDVKENFAGICVLAGGYSVILLACALVLLVSSAWLQGVA